MVNWTLDARSRGSICDDRNEELEWALVGSQCDQVHAVHESRRQTHIYFPPEEHVIITIPSFSIFFFVWCPKRLGWRIMGTMDSFLDSVQPNFLEYTISMRLYHSSSIPQCARPSISRSCAYSRASHDRSSNQLKSLTVLFDESQLKMFVPFAECQTKLRGRAPK